MTAVREASDAEVDAAIATVMAYGIHADVQEVRRAIYRAGLNAAEARAAASEADAGRYRWLRSHDTDVSQLFARSVDGEPLGIFAEASLDAAVDAARGAK